VAKRLNGRVPKQGRGHEDRRQFGDALPPDSRRTEQHSFRFYFELGLLPQERQEVIATDPYPYGVRANRATLEAMTRASYEQGLTPGIVGLEELFHPATLERLPVSRAAPDQVRGALKALRTSRVGAADTPDSRATAVARLWAVCRRPEECYGAPRPFASRNSRIVANTSARSWSENPPCPPSGIVSS
jgi:hypothetical protein